MSYKQIIHIAPILILTVCCEKLSDVQTQGSESTFTASIMDTKSVSFDGRQSFKEGEMIDLWDINTHELKNVVLTRDDISADGKHASFKVGFGSDVPVLAIYPGGWSSECWPKADEAPHFNGVNGLRDGIASAVSLSGSDRNLVFSNLLSCISFSSSVSVSAVNTVVVMTGNGNEDFATGITVNPSTGEASAYSPSVKKSISTANAALDTDDIRLWVLPELALPNGFTMRICTAGGDIVKERAVNVPFSLAANKFLEIGDIDCSPVSISIQATDVSFKDGTFFFMPSDADVYYIATCDKLENLATFVSDAQITAGIMEYYFKTYGADYAPYDSYPEFMLNEVCCRGNCSVVMPSLSADTDYVVLVFAVDADMNVLSGLTRLAFHTSEAPSATSYSDFIGQWDVSGTIVNGSSFAFVRNVENSVWTISANVEGESYFVSGCLSSLDVNNSNVLYTDTYLAYFDVENSCVSFPVGNDNPGTASIIEGGNIYKVHLAGITNDQYIKNFSLVMNDAGNLLVSGVNYIAGEYHRVNPVSGEVSSMSAHMTNEYLSVSSLSRISE